MVILRRQKTWQIEQVVPIDKYPEALAVGNLPPGGAPTLLVKSSDVADMENLILYGRQGRQWLQRWRIDSGREVRQRPRLQIVGYTFADKGKLLAIAANRFDERFENNFRGAELPLYQWQSDGMRTIAQLAFTKPLLALIPISEKGIHFIIIQAGGLGRELTYNKP
jgi:hypothetical protein